MTLITPQEAWKEISTDLISVESTRFPQQYITVCKQFDVVNNPRYQRNASGATMCNIYLWDCTKAMSCEVPHWVDPVTGVEVPMGKGRELSANGVFDWFFAHGLDAGWMRCSAEQAKKRASAGYPTVVLWKNPGKIGHVAMVLPGMDYIHIAQAGSHNYFDVNIKMGFGGIRDLAYYTHD